MMRQPAPWIVRQDDGGRFHVVPAGDTHPHVLTTGCACRPVEIVNGICHNSFDGREDPARTPVSESERGGQPSRTALRASPQICLAHGIEYRTENCPQCGPDRLIANRNEDRRLADNLFSRPARSTLFDA